jgi:hypothetical protein
MSHTFVDFVVMLGQAVSALRTDRRLQIGAAIVVLAGAAFAWWTISPLFLTTTVVETGGAATGGRAISRGELQRVDDTHKGTGPVLIVEEGGKLFVRFENVAIQNGPDLHVYLGRGAGGAYDGSRDLYLGALKATNGTFTYDLPAGTRTEDYTSVVVWCRAFSVLFTWADLKAP